MPRLKCYGIAQTESGDVFISRARWGWDAPAAEDRAHDAVVALCEAQHIERLAIVWSWSRRQVSDVIL